MRWRYYVAESRSWNANMYSLHEKFPDLFYFTDNNQTGSLGLFDST